MIREPNFQFIPNIKFIPAPVPDIFPIVKKRQERKTATPTIPAATGP